MKPRQIVLYATFLVLLGVAIGRLPQLLARFSDDHAWTGALDDTRRLIRDKYVEPVDEKDLIRGGIEGMVGSLNDPYSEFVAPADEASFEQSLTGKYAGIGARIDVSAGTLEGVVIQTPMEGSPALAAGLRPGDRIVEIEGASTLGEPFDSSIAKLKGEPGTSVTVRVRRPIWDAGALESLALPGNVLDPRRLPTPALGEPFAVTLTRAALSDRSVKGLYFDNARAEWAFDIPAGETRAAYVRIEQFTDRTAAEFKGALLAAGAIGKSGDPRLPQALIIDVRDNPGGLLDQAIEIADLFLSEGVIVSTKRRADASAPPVAAAITRADAEAIVPASLPVIILVNERSASASEVFAGALKDNGRAIVLGHRSFGKGLVQTIEPLPTLPGALLKLTEQRFYLPAGQMIHRVANATQWGVDPTPGYEVEDDAATSELAMAVRAALDAIRPKADAPAAAITAASTQGEAKLRDLFATLKTADAWSTPQRIRDRIGDAQLAGAMEAIAKRITSGDAGGAVRWIPLRTPTAAALPALTPTDRERQVLERTQVELRAQLARVELRLTQLRVPLGTTDAPPAPALPGSPPPSTSPEAAPSPSREVPR